MHRTISQDNHLMLIAEVQKNPQSYWVWKKILNGKHVTKRYNCK